MRATATIGGLCLVLLLLASLALSQVGAQGVASGPVLRGTSGGQYQLDSWAIGAGGSADGGPFALVWAAGQADVGVLSSADYTLRGGIWGGHQALEWHQVYLPVILRQ